MSEPTTTAGRDLLRYVHGLPPLFLTPTWEKGILAIEAEASADALDVEAQRRFVDWVRLWWAGPNGFPVVRAGSPEVADEDFEDMERELAAIGIRLAARQP